MRLLKDRSARMNACSPEGNLPREAIERLQQEDESVVPRETIPEEAIEKPQRGDYCLQSQGEHSQRRPMKKRRARINAYSPKGHTPRGGHWKTVAR